MTANSKHQPASPAASAAGLVLVDKPAGWTSHDVVGKIRRLAGTRKVGHAGTLDPMATGLLLVGVNKATKLLTYLVGADKTYTATIRLGQNTDTDDADGEITQTRFANAVTEDMIGTAIASLTGAIDQVPSSVSAIKVDGKRAYARIRAGEQVQLQARRVHIHDFSIHRLTRHDGGRIQDLDVTVTCSSGTYIRALARDLGELLNTGGHLTALRRTAIGPYRIEAAATIDELTEDFTMMALDSAVAELFPIRRVTDAEALELCHGRFLAPTASGDEATELTLAQSPSGQAVALISDKTDRDGNPVAKPELVFLNPQELQQ
ncbi:tRNA pseudouridine(55) synthase TruB [Micrococcoides hystricis]|uniref:tRNA pseudouridine synthase B n=1 Tax=Micrococcoides hystricis TaxID=1572761 RepID=A0ABV6P9H4_9MICC